jgi:hypothetical protein
MESILIFMGMVTAPAIILTLTAAICHNTEKELDRMIWDEAEQLLYFDDVDTTKL